MTERLWGGVIILACITLRPFAETDPVVHILVQLPVLAIAGYVLSPRKVVRPATAIALTVVAVTATAFWMLPRSIDLAVANGWADAVKFVTVPVCIGMALSMAWPNLPDLVRPFLKAQVLSMLGVLGFVYLHAPIRICNAYLQSDQERLGFGFLFVAGFLALLWIYPVFSGGAFRAPARNDVRLPI